MDRQIKYARLIGRAARDGGVPRMDCPYPDNGLAAFFANAWVDGWLTRDREILKTHNRIKKYANEIKEYCERNRVRESINAADDLEYSPLYRGVG